MFHAGTRDADVVGFLEGIIADQVGRHLPGEHNQWNRIHVCRCNTGNGIGCTRPGCDDDDTRLAVGTRITIRRMRGRLFMPDQDMLHLVLRIEGIIDVQYRTTRVAEQVFDAFVLQCTHKYFCASQFHLRISRNCGQ